jgi:hypothetical protein
MYNNVCLLSSSCTTVLRFLKHFSIYICILFKAAYAFDKSSGSCLENREYGRRDPSRWPRGTFYPLKLAITSPTSGGRSVGIVRSRTQTMEFSLVLYAFDSTEKGHPCQVLIYSAVQEVESKGFWRKRIILRTSGFLKFTHRPEF